MAKAGFTLGELAEALQARLDGDPARVVTGIAPLESAGPDQISFLTDLRYRDTARTSRAGAFLVPSHGADAARCGPDRGGGGRCPRRCHRRRGAPERSRGRGGDRAGRAVTPPGPRRAGGRD